jgi:phosphate transport system protein
VRTAARASYRQQLHTELEHLDGQLVEMTALAAAALGDATRALLEADLSLAEKVIAGDDQIDAIQRQVDERAVELLARQAPVATDLRVVVAGLRMSSTIERMGDLARHVAKLVRLRFPHHVIPADLEPLFAEMGATGVRLAEKAGQVITSRDLTVAAEMGHDDDALDDLHRRVFDELASPTWSHPVQAAVDVTLGSRYFERFGDHAVSLSERVQFLVTGQWDLAAEATATPHPS